MRLSEISELLGCDFVQPCAQFHEADVEQAFAADLMSEVLAYCPHGALLLTALANVQSVHTADVADLAAIVFVNGKRPDRSVLDLARERSIPLLSTRRTMLEACGILFGKGMRPACKR